MPWLALAVPLVAVTVLGLLLNGYILLVVLLTKQVHTANTLLLLHLGTVDVLLCALFLLFAAPGALGARGPTDAASSWASDPPLCSLHSFLAALLHPLALWTVCGLNCDRCAAIAAPLHYARLVSTRRAAIFILSTWVLCLTLALPPLFVPQTSIPPSASSSFLILNSTTTEEPDWNTTTTLPSCPPVPSSTPTAPYILLLILGGCSSEWTSTGDRTQPPRIPTPPLSPWYPSAYTVFTLLLPAGLILACNIKVLTIARYHRHRIAAAIFEVTLSAQVTITHQRNPFPLTKPRPPAAGPGGWIGSGLFGNRRSALLTVVQLIGSLLLLYFPFYSVMLWHSFQSVAGGGGGNSSVPPMLLTASSALLACSPPVNGFIYGVRSKVLRRTFANYWRKQMSKSAVNQEIQARTPSTCGSRRPSLTPLGLQRRASMDACLGFPALPPPPSSAASTSSSSSAASSAGGSKCPNKPRITRVASELSWRPLGVASPIAGVATMHVPRRTRSFRDRRTTTTGLHTLQVPNLQRCESTMGCPRDVHSSSSATPFLGRSQYFLQRVLGYYHHGRAGFGVGGHFVNSHNAHPMAGGCSGAGRRRSPRIMVTRALSQEEGNEIDSEVHSSGGPERRLSSSTTTLLERRMSREQRALSSGDSPEEDCSVADGRIVRWRMGSTGTDEISVTREMNDNVSGEKTGSPRLCTSLDSIPVRGGGEELYEGQAGPPAEDEGRQGRRRVFEESGGRAASPRHQQDGQRVNRAALKRIRFGIGDPVHHSWPSRTRGGMGGENELCTFDGGSEKNESEEARAEA